MLDKPQFRSLGDFELPRLVQLRPNLFGASFFLMKLLPARFMLDEAERKGALKPGGLIAETTSGTFGLALAMLARRRGYRLSLVSDPAIDAVLRRRLEELGATVEIIDAPHPRGGYQVARMERLNAILAENPDAFWPSQYANTANPASYELVTKWLTDRLGTIDCVVGPVGSGGSMSGIARGLRRRQGLAHVIGVDTPNSVIFGQPDGKRLLRGLGNSLMPDNVDHTAFDEVHWVDAPEAFAATRRLHRDHALYCGGTSGAAHLVADWWAAKRSTAKTIVILPDEGHRYASTIYNDDWLQAIDGYTGELPRAPVPVMDPRDVRSGWSCFGWDRRTLDGVINERKAA